MKPCLASLFVLFVLVAPVRADGLAPGISQRVIQFSAAHGEGVHRRTFADCYDSEGCLISLTRRVSQSGGNPGLLKQGEQGVAHVDGLSHSFEFTPVAGEHFCAAEFDSHTMGPTFLSRAPELWVEISAARAHIEIKLPQNAERSWVNGFLILYGAKPGAARVCTLGEEIKRHHCKGRCEAMSF